MKKSELVTLVAEKTGFSKKDTEKTIEDVYKRQGQDHRGERYFAVRRYSVLSVEMLLLLVRIGNHGDVYKRQGSASVRAVSALSRATPWMPPFIWRSTNFEAAARCS